MDTKIQDKPVRRAEILYRKLDDEGILFDSETSSVHILNPTSELIWSCCDGDRDAGEITSEILKRYKVEKEQAEQDVERVLRQFREFRLLKE